MLHSYHHNFMHIKERILCAKNHAYGLHMLGGLKYIIMHALFIYLGGLY